ncbi:family 10 glycosylhydrolase [Clostridium sp.]|uniref:glycoside hydrolase family 10 protein n=1 Tax=Clostridium sp. TaxID=1506 RepID=UPI003079E09F
MAKQVQRAIGWVAAFLLAVGMLFLPVSKAYADPVSGGSPGSGEMRGVWVSYLDWNGWAKDEAGYKKAMDQTLDLCVQKGLNAVFLQVRPDGDAMYPSQYFPWSKFASGKQGKNPGYDPLAYAVQAAHQRGLQLHAWINPYRITGYLNRYSDLCASNPAIAWAKDGDSSNDRWVLCQNGEYYYNPAIPQVRQLIIDDVKEIVTNYGVDGIHFDDYFYPNLDDSKAETWFDYPEYQASGTSLSVAAWRRNNVNELVRGVYSAVKSIRPQALFGISPEGYLQNLRKDTRQFTDVDAWMTQSGYVDYLMPQIYWGFEAKQNGQAAGYAFANCLNEWVTLKKKGNVKLYVGLALYKTGTDAVDGNEVPEWQRYHDIMKREVQAGRATGQVSGYCFYDLSSLTRAAAAEEVANVTALFH